MVDVFFGLSYHAHIESGGRSSFPASYRTPQLKALWPSKYLSKPVFVPSSFIANRERNDFPSQISDVMPLGRELLKKEGLCFVACDVFGQPLGNRTGGRIDATRDKCGRSLLSRCSFLVRFAPETAIITAAVMIHPAFCQSPLFGCV